MAMALLDVCFGRSLFITIIPLQFTGGVPSADVFYHATASDLEHVLNIGRCFLLPLLAALSQQ
jgi:hypothetical protein